MWLTAAVIAVLTSAVVVLLWWAATSGLNGAELVTARLDALKIGLSIGVGSGGVVALYLSWRRQHSTERTLAHQEHDSAERRLTELYLKAVEQLGSPQAAVRHGGLYALERVAQDNPRQQQTVANVLCAYLRNPYTPPPDTGRPRPLGLRRPLLKSTDHSHTRANPLNGSARETQLQEREVRLTAQRILHQHLRPGPDPNHPQRDFWPDIGIDLTGATLIDFSLKNCKIAYSSFQSTTFTGEVWFDGARFGGDADFRGAEFGGHARFLGAKFGGDSGFFGAKFDSVALFHGAKFGGDVGFGWADFGDFAVFDETEFSGNADFCGARFAGDAAFQGAEFGGAAKFGEAEFGRYAVFSGAKFGSTTWFVDARFAGDATFGGAKFNGHTVVGAKFDGNADFDGAEFGGGAQFGGKFGGDAKFVGTKFDNNADFGDIMFDGTEFAGDVRFDEAVYDGRVFNPAEHGVQRRAAEPESAEDADPE